MSLSYVIRYKWPEGKVRYRQGGGLCQDIEDADVFTMVEANDILRRSRDAYTVWRIVATKVRIR